MIRAGADQAERDRRLPQSLFLAMAEANLFRMYLPRQLGGLEVDPMTYMRGVEEAARIDGSAGWNLSVWGATGWLGGSLRPDVAATIWSGDPRIALAGTPEPTGKAIKMDGGYRVSGRWGFGSGIEHSTWAMGLCAVVDNDGPLVGLDGRPEMRLIFFPTAQCQIHDTWHIEGLRATGSHDFSVADLFVPEERSLPGLDTPPSQPGPLYAGPPITILNVGIPAVALGIARGAIDALVDLAGVTIRKGSTGPLRERPSVQADVARAEALVRSGRAFLYESIEEIWAAVLRGDKVSVKQRALARIAFTNAGLGAAQAVDLVRNAAASTAIYTSSPLARAFRDIHTLTQHFVVSTLNNELGGRVLLGMEPGRALF
jgi:alkylation response protein AidB-like acyl-CoA dehydrogenase